MARTPSNTDQAPVSCTRESGVSKEQTVPQCFVINLPQSGDRREQVTQDFTRIGLNFEFFAATNGRALSPAEEALCLQGAARESVELEMAGGRKVIVENAQSPAEKGCSFSHLRLYQHILDLGLERAVIMEDDVLPNEYTKLVLESLDCIKEPWDIVNFSNNSGLKNAPLARKYYFGQDKQYYFQRQGMRNETLDAIFNRRRLIFGTYCYVITRHACEVLVKLGYPVRLNADYLLGLIGYNRLRTFMVFPHNLSFIAFSSAANNSTIMTNVERPQHRLVRVK